MISGREGWATRAVIVAFLVTAAAVLPWVLLLLALRATLRRFRPQRIVRARRLPIATPGDPLAASAWLVLLVIVVAAWAFFARPLWRTYVTDAMDYRANASSVASAVSSGLVSTGEPLASARIGRGWFAYSLGPGDEGTRATVSYFWRGIVQRPPGPADPVESARRDGPRGSLVAVYRRDLTGDQQDRILGAFDRINLDPAATARRAAADVPILLRSVRSYWLEDYAGVLDTPGAWGRLLLGLPAVVPLHIAAFVVGLLPDR
ncbi:MAG: hypothetical protein Q8P31_11430 [Bacillota bacterium]|nr:hypothetical protein [Bacillota bacterium]